MKTGQNPFTFVFVGRIVGDKGNNELVEAFKRLKPHSAKLILVGTFEEILDPVKPKTKQEVITTLILNGSEGKQMYVLSMSRLMHSYFQVTERDSLILF